MMIQRQHLGTPHITDYANENLNIVTENHDIRQYKWIEFKP